MIRASTGTLDVVLDVVLDDDDVATFDATISRVGSKESMQSAYSREDGFAHYVPFANDDEVEALLAALRASIAVAMRDARRDEETTRRDWFRNRNEQPALSKRYRAWQEAVAFVEALDSVYEVSPEVVPVGAHAAYQVQS